MSASRRWITAGGVSFAALLASLPAAAQASCAQAVEAERLETEGVALRSQSRNAEALDRFRRAYALCGGARALGRMGLAEGAMERFVDAEVHLGQALSGTSDPWIESYRRDLETARSRASARLATLELSGDGPAAEVVMQGEVLGRWPAQRRFRVVAGAVTFTLRAAGCAATTRSVTVSAESTLRESVTLSCGEASSGNTRRTLAWVSGGVAVAALGVGAVAMGLYLGDLSTWNDDSQCFAPNGRPRRENCPGAWSTVSTMGPVAWAGFGAAAAFGVTSALLFATSSGGAERRASLVSCGPGPGAFGVSCGGRF